MNSNKDLTIVIVLHNASDVWSIDQQKKSGANGAGVKL